MNKLMLTAAVLAFAAAPAQAHHRKSRYAHPAPHYPDSVMLDGKQYRICKPGVPDDCVQPRQAGLGFGNRPTDRYRARGGSADRLDFRNATSDTAVSR